MDRMKPPHRGAPARFCTVTRMMGSISAPSDASATEPLTSISPRITHDQTAVPKTVTVHVVAVRSAKAPPLAGRGGPRARAHLPWWPSPPMRILVLATRQARRCFVATRRTASPPSAASAKNSSGKGASRSVIVRPRSLTSMAPGSRPSAIIVTAPAREEASGEGARTPSSSAPPRPGRSTRRRHGREGRRLLR